MTIFKGIGASAGIVRGKLYFLKRDSAVEKKRIEETEKEIARFDVARQTASQQLKDLYEKSASEIGEEHAVLFDIHSMMLQDDDFIAPVTQMIKTEKVNAEFAVKTASARLAQDFSDMDDEYMQARAADVRDISKRVINILAAKSETSSVSYSAKEPSIFAADEFTPSETAQFDRRLVLAIVSQYGAVNSHTAIFARTMGIPAIVGLGDTFTDSLSGKDVILDGRSGEVFVEPSEEVAGQLLEKTGKEKQEKESLEKFRGKPTLTKSGRQVKLFANIGSLKDADSAIDGDAEGVGLFRTEFIYLGRDDFPDEETQYQSYKGVLEKMGQRQVVIRTLDIGADKQAGYFGLPKEENPALGMRAIRICLTRPDIFKTQLRAIYRASAYGNAAIMFPMISSLDELVRAKAAAKAAREELAAQNIAFKEIPVGIMVETPASAVISDILAAEADFFSIGTNDLTQYTLAIDRQNESVVEFCDTRHEAILRLIRMTCENAHKAGIWCGICGSLGGDLALTKTFVDMRIDELSVEPSAILKLRSVIAQC